LKRCDISVAFVQHIQIDRLEGAVICAVNTKIGPALLAEASILNKSIATIAEFLDSKASAERNFIADAHDVARRDLHDGVLQTLAALRMRLATIARRKEQSNEAVRLDISKTIDIIALEQTRLRGLLETNTHSDGTVNLVTRLDVCLRSIALQWDISIALNAEDPAVPMDPESALNIENLVREVMANAVRHTASRSLTVSLSLKHDALMLAVNDLMSAKHQGETKQMASLPLQSSSLRQRLKIANAKAYVDGLDQGVLLSIRIPMEQIDDA
jgi:signal transduction histidine kinase